VDNLNKASCIPTGWAII